MLEHIIMAGSGGQGIQFIGQLLANAAVRQGLEAMYVPSYGAERRGGPSFCAVVVSDGPVYAPFVQHPDVLLAFDQRARLQYAATIHGQGLMVINTDLATQPAEGEQARIMPVSANTLARQIRSQGGPINLIMLGAYLAQGCGVSLETIREIVEHRFAKKPDVLHFNLVALAQGAEAVKEKA